MKKVKVTLLKSQSGRTERLRRNIQALGLGKTNSSVEVTLTPQTEGIIRRLHHMVSVENI